MARGCIRFNKSWAEKWYRFLDEVRKHGNQALAARDAGVSGRDMEEIRKIDADRMAEWVQAVEESTGSLIVEAKRRAADGILEDVYYQGEVVGQQRKFSDALLMFLIKGQDPRYSLERREISGPGGAEIPTLPIQLSLLETDEIRTLMDIAKKFRSSLEE